MPQFEIITDMPVKSLITSPREGFLHRAGAPLTIRRPRLERTCAGRTGRTVIRRRRVLAHRRARPCPRRFAWRRFEFTLTDPPRGAIEIVARATDHDGRAQPLESVPWNPRGYLNNMCHRVRGRIGRSGTRGAAGL